MTVFVIANLAAMYLWFCQRSLEKSLAPHREINLMPDLNKRVAVGTGDGFGTGTSIAKAPRYGASAPVAAAVATMPAVSAEVATVPPSTPVKAKAAKPKSTSRAKAAKAPTTKAKPASAKAPVAKKATVAKAVTAKATKTKSVAPNTVAPNTVAPKAVAPKAAGKSKADKMDDVSLISGVGPTLKKKLAGAGVTSLKQISKMSVKQLETLDDELNLGGRCINEQWIEQAKELVAGKPPRAKIDKAAAGQV
ncbi:MAG: hypothetical protein WA921_07945 [Ahrensia sp.]